MFFVQYSHSDSKACDKICTKVIFLLKDTGCHVSAFYHLRLQMFNTNDLCFSGFKNIWTAAIILY